MRLRLSTLFLLFFCTFIRVRAQDYSVQLTSGTFTPAASGPVVGTPAANEIFGGKFFRAIQFYTIPTEADKARLRSKGIALHRYLPNNLFTAILPAIGAQQALAGEANVRAVFTMPAAHKIAGDLKGGKIPAHAQQPGGTVALTVVQQPGLSVDEVAARLRAAGVTVTESLPHLETHAIVIPAARLAEIAALPFVAFVDAAEPTPTPDNNGGRSAHRSNTLATSYPTGLKYDGTGVTVALNDDGFIGPHIDYQGRLAAQYTTANSGDHGDHCAGIIFGAGNRVPTARGMASGATLRVYQAVSGTALGYQAFDSIYSHYPNLGVRITSTSYSDGTNAGYTTRARLMDQTIRQMPELMHVFSAGNAGTSGTPSTWFNITGGQKMGKNVIAVGNLDSLDNLNSSSSRGPAHDGRIKPEVCAVGTNVQSTVAGSAGNAYDNYTGTSMACPGTAGVLAQLYHAWKSTHSGVNPKSAMIKAALMNTADDLGNAGPDFRFGYGRINARRAWNLLSASQFFVDTVSQGTVKTHSITVPAGTQEVRVMLYWPDYEATANAAKALVNDLNLTLTTPASATVLPWKLNPTANATALNQPAFQGIDSLNNVEQVTIPTPAAGTYTVTVTGSAIPQGPQAYYVVYEMRGGDVTLTYPIGGEALVPGQTETIRWDAYGANSGTFTLEYSTDSGASWSTISSSVSASLRHYNWAPPATVTGRGMIRVTRGGSSDASDAGFTVIGVPASLSVNWVCADSIKVSYSSVTGAARYEMTVLGAAYMDSVGTSTTTNCVGRGLNTGIQNWYSIQAVAPNGAKGRRATAQMAPVLPFNCPVAAPPDLYVQNITTPPAAISQCAGGMTSDSVRIVIKNAGATLFNNIAVGYSVNGGTPVTATVPFSIVAQQTAAFTFPQPVTLAGAGTYMLKVWTQHNGDAVPGNDTSTRSIVVSTVPAMSLPVTQDFEGAVLCDTIANCGATTCALPTGWTNAANGATDDIDWRAWRGPTPTNNATGTTGPTMDFKPGIGSGRYVYLEADGCAGKVANLISPCIDLGGVNDGMLRWGYHMRGTGTGELHVDVHADGVWMMDAAQPLIGAQGAAWMTGTLSLVPYSGKVVQVRFRGITGPTAQSDIALDGIEVYRASSVDGMAGDAMGVSIYPNPSAASFGVTLGGLKGNASLTVTDAAGRVVEVQEVTPSGGIASATVSLRGAPAGVYILAIRSGGDGVVVRKLVRL